MNAKERLHAVQQKLVARGVTDVKFFFDSAKLGYPTKALEGAAAVLEAYVEGRCTPAADYAEALANRRFVIGA